MACLRLNIGLKVPKCEIFVGLDFPPFYHENFMGRRLGDLGIEIKKFVSHSFLRFGGMQ